MANPLCLHSEAEHGKLAQCTGKGIGKRFGRPFALNEKQKQSAMARLSAGISMSVVDREFNTAHRLFSG